MNKEELKNQIITLLKDIFNFDFYYDKETDHFTNCDESDDCDDYDNYTDIYIDEEGMILGLDIAGGWSGFISFNKILELNELIKEFYK